jgi:hypothetical protein
MGSRPLASRSGNGIVAFSSCVRTVAPRRNSAFSSNFGRSCEAAGRKRTRGLPPDQPRCRKSLACGLLSMWIAYVDCLNVLTALISAQAPSYASRRMLL